MILQHFLSQKIFFMLPAKKSGLGNSLFKVGHDSNAEPPHDGRRVLRWLFLAVFSTSSSSSSPAASLFPSSLKNVASENYRAGKPIFQWHMY